MMAAAASLVSSEVFKVFIEAFGAVGAPAALFSGMLAYVSYSSNEPMDKVGEAATLGAAASFPLGTYLAAQVLIAGLSGSGGG
jgi:hypothetical protein